MSFSLSAESKETFTSTLREKGLRPTKQRSCVYAVILTKRDHPTADEIYDRVRRYLPGTSFATVYNCLQTLVGCGLVRQVNMERSPSRFCPNLAPHAHFKCSETGKIHDLEIDAETLRRVLDLVPKQYRTENFDLSFTGKEVATLNSRN